MLEDPGRTAADPDPLKERPAAALVSYLVNSHHNLLVFFAVGCVALPRVVPATARHRALPTTKILRILWCELTR